jgi:DNA-binding IclR family transcriptional regulator
VTSIAVPIQHAGQTPAALAVVFATSTVDSYERTIEELQHAAARISEKLAH